jgi:hypothetical protein
MEQKKQLQIDAGIPHLPTDLTYECRIAIAGEGERAYDWSDKPHRLVYDLSRQVEADAIRIEELIRQRDGWEETALMYAQNVDFWKSKLTKAEKDRDGYLAERNKFQLYLQRTYADWELEVAAVDALTAKLAELEGGK